VERRFPLRGLLAVTTPVVIALGLVAELTHAYAPDATWTGFFSLSVEANLPTWYSALLLFGNAILFASIAWRAPRDRHHWTGLAVVFTYLSLDEAAELHEHLGGTFDLGGALTFDWVIPATAVLAGLAALYLPFVLRLPARLRHRLVIAGILYVTGALVLELPLGWWVSYAGDDNLGYGLIDLVEESLEMIGASLALLALHEERP
jgi:hypothetical protein